MRHRCDVILNVDIYHATSIQGLANCQHPLNKHISFLHLVSASIYINMASSPSAKTTVQSKMDFGAGLKNQKPAVSGQKDETQTSRVLAMGSYFLSGCMA